MRKRTRIETLACEVGLGALSAFGIRMKQEFVRDPHYRYLPGFKKFCENAGYPRQVQECGAELDGEICIVRTRFGDSTEISERWAPSIALGGKHIYVLDGMEAQFTVELSDGRLGTARLAMSGSEVGRYVGYSPQIDEDDAFAPVM